VSFVERTGEHVQPRVDDGADDGFDDGPGPPPKPTSRGRTIVRRVARTLLVAVLVFLVVVGWSIGTTLAAPGSDGVAARLAEWGRDHGLGPVVTWLERQQYEHNQPKIGGAPPGGIPTAGGALAPRKTTHAARPGLPAPPPIAPVAGGVALPGEGRWQTVVAVHGQPAVRVATLRPDAQHTSYLAGVMWIDPTFVRGQLQPGYHDPGGSWQAATSLTPAVRSSVVAAFNSGFRLNGDSHGGYYSEGRTAVPLVNGAASLVLRTDGTAVVGTWNHEVAMSSRVASVRQNLVMLVDHGVVNPTCQSGGQAEWGNTIGQAAYIDRSAFGVTADGAEVYVGGPALSVCTLGEILRAAGVRYGLELDINPTWVTGVYFHHTSAGGLQGYRLYPTEHAPPTHYLLPSSRDWYGWYARS
jgi:hypothetical protein